MYTDLFSAFLASDDTLRIYRDETLVFSSEKDRLLPLMEYIGEGSGDMPPVIIFDKIMGNAAALLAVKANCREVYSPLGSDLAIKTLEKHHIEYHLSETVPYIQRRTAKACAPWKSSPSAKSRRNFTGK